MFLSPSKILYTHNEQEFNASAERTFKEMTKTVHLSTVFPKLQVVKKDGFYFTLNDAKLQVYRYLEKLGKCGSVEVERIALKNVPEGIKSLMKAPNSLQVFKVHKSNDNHKKGKYQHISMSSCNDMNTDTCVACSKYCDTVGEQADDDNDDSSASENSEVDSSDWSDDDDDDDSTCDVTESSEEDVDDNKLNESESLI